MAYKRTTRTTGKTRTTTTQNSNGSRTYSQSSGQKLGVGSSTRKTISTQSNGKRTLTQTTISPSGWVNKRVTVLNKPIPKKTKFPKSTAQKIKSRKTRKSKPMTIGQLKALSIIFGILVLIALFTH